MIVFASSVTDFIYKRIAKPVLFKQKPDAVHEQMLMAAGATQKAGVIRGAMRLSWAYRNTAKLQQKIHGITFDNPVGLSAGLDKNFELVPTMKAVGFGFMEGGSITFRRCEGNPKPWFHRLPKTRSLVVHAGLANHGAEVIVPRIQSYKPSVLRGFPINISVAKTNSKEASTDTEAIKDYIGSLKIIKKAGVGDMLTLNISCPNAYGGEPFTTPKRLEQLLTEVDKLKLKQPVFIKMPVDFEWKEFKELVQVAAGHKITGLTISNLTKNRDAIKDDLADNIRGGLSGKPVFQKSNDLIAHTYCEYGDRFTIIGVGGIFTAEDAYTKIKLGASLVELVTGLIFEGPQLIGQINRGLVKLLESDGYSNISEAIGADNPRNS